MKFLVRFLSFQHSVVAYSCTRSPILTAYCKSLQNIGSQSQRQLHVPGRLPERLKYAGSIFLPQFLVLLFPNRSCVLPFRNPTFSFIEVFIDQRRSLQPKTYLQTSRNQTHSYLLEDNARTSKCRISIIMVWGQDYRLLNQLSCHSDFFDSRNITPRLVSFSCREACATA